MNAEDIAYVCHEANRAIQIIQADESIPLAPSWDKATAEMQESVIDGVEKILSGEIATPEDSHQNWCDFKIAQGWRLGSVKDEEKKEHPLLVDYTDLPHEARVKDRLFFAIVNALKDEVE